MGDFVGPDGGIAGGRAGGFGIVDLGIFRLARADEPLLSRSAGEDEGEMPSFWEDVGCGEFDSSFFLTAAGRERAFGLKLRVAVEADLDGREGEVYDGAADRLLHCVRLDVGAVSVTDGDNTGESGHEL